MSLNTKITNDFPISFSVVFLIILIIAIIGAFKIYGSGKSVVYKSNDIKSTSENIKPISPTPQIKNEVTLAFAGDIMLARGVKYSVDKNFGGDFSKLFENLASLKDPDIFFANLEGPVSDVGKDLHNLYSFRMDPKVLEVLKNAGLDIVSFANNHVGDWGRTAFDDTRRRLDGAGILYTGSGDNKADAEQPTIIEKDGIKIGFLGFTDVGPEWLAATENQSGVLLANDPDIANIIKNASMQVDVLITSFHWGIEYSEHNARQTALAHTAIDNGAKLVIGHHPHVIEATENYKDGLIAYSLGNFIFDQYFSAETMKGMILKVTLDTQTKSIKNSEKYIVKLNSAFQPETPVPFK
jgi:poly-gamma-glutamate synthesis protein (capsule biosynthesis protein)